MQQCTTDIKQWICTNHLKLNTSKTEVLLIGNNNDIKKIKERPPVHIGQDIVDISDSARNICAVLESNLSLVEHVNSVTRVCYMKLRQISHIRGYPAQDATATLVRSLIKSKLDYVNSLLYGIPDSLLHKLQLIQNNAACLVMRNKKSDQVTPLIMHLHWLPVKQRIKSIYTRST